MRILSLLFSLSFFLFSPLLLPSSFSTLLSPSLLLWVTLCLFRVTQIRSDAGSFLATSEARDFLHPQADDPTTQRGRQERERRRRQRDSFWSHLRQPKSDSWLLDSRDCFLKATSLSFALLCFTFCSVIVFRLEEHLFTRLCMWLTHWDLFSQLRTSVECSNSRQERKRESERERERERESFPALTFANRQEILTKLYTLSSYFSS